MMKPPFIHRHNKEKDVSVEGGLIAVIDHLGVHYLLAINRKKINF